jgi:hypothetical protein
MTVENIRNELKTFIKFASERLEGLEKLEEAALKLQFKDEDKEHFFIVHHARAFDQIEAKLKLLSDQITNAKLPRK